MKYKELLILFLTCTIGLSGCKEALPQAEKVKGVPALFPDYTGVTVPCNIAPLNFKLKEAVRSIAVLSDGRQQIRIDSDNGSFEIPEKKWHALLNEATGKTIQIVIYACTDGHWMEYEPFSIKVAEEPVDPYLVYRRIAPGYRMWGEMGIYQRCLESFEENVFLSNKLMNNNCMNCHSFCMQDPDRMLFHQRATHAGTYMIINGNMEKLNTKTGQTISALVYPSWHPSGRYVAFSTNDTKQDFHLSDPNRIEVFDNNSDVVVYDVERHEIVTAPQLFSPDQMETFPTFSPDGKTLYFCSASSALMPEFYRNIKYSLVSISFDPEARTFGQKVDTLYNAGQEGRSAKFPRVSPDGRYLLYTVSGYGNFSIWHKDADLQMLDLSTSQVDSLPDVNSDDVESYHSWSSNSRWFVFSSRRDNGLYTCPYICYFDEKGIAAKPFLLPQKSTGYYEESLFSFNIPEFVKGKIEVDTYKLIRTSKYGAGTNVSFIGK